MARQRVPPVVCHTATTVSGHVYLLAFSYIPFFINFFLNRHLQLGQLPILRQDVCPVSPQLLPALILMFAYASNLLPSWFLHYVCYQLTHRQPLVQQLDMAQDVAVKLAQYSDLTYVFAHARAHTHRYTYTATHIINQLKTS